MLEVSFDLAAVMAMLSSIVWPGNQIEVDSLNDPTVKPFPDGNAEVGLGSSRFKHHRVNMFQNDVRYGPFQYDSDRLGRVTLRFSDNEWSTPFPDPLPE